MYFKHFPDQHKITDNICI